MTSLFIPAKSSTSPASIRRSDTPAATRGKFIQTFDSCLKTAAGTAAAPAPENLRNRAVPDPTGRIKLGTVSKTDPTVSHLLVKNPAYDSSCWEIIHSKTNQDKPYTRIPEGTAVYLHCGTGEITWEGSCRNRSSGSPSNRMKAAAAVSATSNPEISDVIEAAVSKAAADYNLPRELINGVIKAESDFQVRAVSPAGARGLMQLMPETARDLGVDDPFDIRQNIDGGCRYLRKMIDLFDGDIIRALAAYNAGPGTIDRHDGRIPYPETRLYVQRILSYLAGNDAA